MSISPIDQAFRYQIRTAELGSPGHEWQSFAYKAHAFCMRFQCTDEMQLRQVRVASPWMGAGYLVNSTTEINVVTVIGPSKNKWIMLSISILEDY